MVALTQEAIAAAARAKARRARLMLAQAEAELEVTERALRDAVADGDGGNIQRAQSRNKVAKENVEQAAEQVDGVSVLLDMAPNGQPASGPVAELLLRRRKTDV